MRVLSSAPPGGSASRRPVPPAPSGTLTPDGTAAANVPKRRDGMTTDDRAGWGHPVPGRCPGCGGLDLEPQDGHPGQDAADAWICRGCGAAVTREELARPGASPS